MLATILVRLVSMNVHVLITLCFSTQLQYRVKIINPDKRSDFIVHELHGFDSQFDSITSLKVRLMEQFSEYVPSTIEFQVGYFTGKQSTKHWLMCQADLEQMNETLKTSKGKVMWCEGKSDSPKDSSTGNRKRSSPVEPPTSQRQQIEGEVQDYVTQLKEKHGTKYTIPQLRCWARMITTKNHESIDDPPDLPPFSGVQPKKKALLAEAITGAALTFAQVARAPDVTQSNSQSVVIAPSSPTSSTTPITTATMGILPGKVTELRMKKLRELRELQTLLEQNILTRQEFIEQKQLVLDSLRKLTH